MSLSPNDHVGHVFKAPTVYIRHMNVEIKILHDKYFLLLSVAISKSCRLRKIFIHIQIYLKRMTDKRIGGNIYINWFIDREDIYMFEQKKTFIIFVALTIKSTYL